DLEKLPTRRLRKSIAAYNNTPRKCLDFRTPAEVFAAQVLHFECESTSRLSPGRRRSVARLNSKPAARSRTPRRLAGSGRSANSCRHW
ncbi:MAG: hypothetical protein ACK47P_40050, partial [Bradyrhizobium sp.]